jgi:beta-1,3-galactosyltransferase 1
VTEKSNKAVIISKEILENAKKETTKDTQLGNILEKGKQTADIIKNNAKVETKKPTVAKLKSTDIQNFTVEGWPESKSRSAEDYVNYNEPTEILLPQKPFSSASTDDPSQPQVLVVVQSAPKNQLLREEVRRTWGHACVTIHSSWCSLVFILGNLENPQDPLQDEIIFEHNQYGDILQDSNFLDSYNNLTIKSIHILKYFISVSDQIGNKYLLKTDDDSFIHLEALWDLAKYRLAKNSNHLIGYLQLGLKKHHYLPLAHKPTSGNLKKTTWRRWLIPTYMYTKKFFPQFLSGSGYLVTRQASECLLEKSKTVPIVHLEDVYITGLCAASCHLRREHNKGFKARKMEKPPLSQYQIQLSDVVIHYSTGQMDRLYNQTLQLKKDDSEFLTMD